MNVRTAGPAGTSQFKILVIGNIDMWRHPKYYKELRDAGNELAPASAVKEDLACSGSSPARNKSDQVISKEPATAGNQRAPGPGLKQQAIEETVPHNDIEEASGSSNKQQADKAQATKTQASSSKR